MYVMLNKVVFDAFLYYSTAVTSVLNRKTAFMLVCVLRVVANREGSPKRSTQFSDDDKRCEGVKLFYLVLKVFFLCFVLQNGFSGESFGRSPHLRLTSGLYYSRSV